MLVKRKPITPGYRNRIDVVSPELAPHGPEKSLLVSGARRRNGRNNQGKITVRHRGGGARRQLRVIDWKRTRDAIPAKVMRLEYDPNRNAHIALIQYVDGVKAYILAPRELAVGMTVVSGPEAPLTVGNTLPLANIPVGIPVHNLELTAGKGAQLVRGAGTAAIIQSKDDTHATIQLPSREVRLIALTCRATVGVVGNEEHKNAKLGKAGRRRHLGFRPTVRGAAMHPGAHPHGGGEGKNGVGLKYPKTPWGKHALGKKTRAGRKYSNDRIVRDRRKKA